MVLAALGVRVWELAVMWALAAAELAMVLAALGARVLELAVMWALVAAELAMVLAALEDQASVLELI
jgi:hypothetical protein